MAPDSGVGKGNLPRWSCKVLGWPIRTATLIGLVSMCLFAGPGLADGQATDYSSLDLPLYHPKVVYKGAFESSDCIMLSLLKPSLTSARCSMGAGVSGNYLNYLIASLSTALAVKRIQPQAACDLLRHLWFRYQDVGELPLACEIHWLSANVQPSDESLYPLAVDRVELGEQLSLPTHVTRNEVGVPQYPNLLTVWALQYVVEIEPN